MLRYIIAGVATVLALGAVVRLLEPRFAFFPSSGETATPEQFGVPFEATSLLTKDGERLRGWVLTHPAPRAVVLYFHGNGGNLSVWAPILAGIYERGYTVRAIDYRGYGASTGRPTERGLYRDVDAAVEWIAREPGGPVPLVYWGRSLGAAMAAYAATRHTPAGIILESGFPDVRALFRSSPAMRFVSLFSTYRFPANRFLEDARSPVLVMHGDRDRVIPFEAGRQLFEKIRGPKQFATIPGGDHNDLRPPDPAAYWSTVHAFIQSLGRASP
jgi:fermentation-respiration switch protein FrsA (DUF1100 family)